MADKKQRGRPREFRNDAEKQKAYRQRQKADLAHFELAEAMLTLLDERAEALRKSARYWEAKGKQLDICLSTWGAEYVKTLANGSNVGSIEVVVFRYLLARGELVEVGKRAFGEIIYNLK